MEFIINLVQGFIGLGPVILIAIVFCALGLIFGAGLRKSVRAGIVTGVGLAGIFLVVNVITGSYLPALEALSNRMGITKPVIDVGWGIAGAGWGWPGAVGVILGTIAVNLVLVAIRFTKSLWTDFWSLWHGQVLAAMVWGVTGNVLLGILVALIYHIIVMKLADWTAKDNQEFNEMPGITIPCGMISEIGLFAKFVAPLLRKVPVIKDVEASPEDIRDKLGVFGEMPVLGALIGLLIGLAAGYDVAGVLGLAMDTALMLVLLPRMVSVLMEGLVVVAGAVRDWLIERFEDREIYVAVDCAVQLGHPAVMASAIIVMPLAILLAAVLPGVTWLPVASLAVVPYMCGAVVTYTKGNVLHTVLIVLVLIIPFLYIGSIITPMAQTAAASELGLMADTVGAGQQITSFDPGGDPLAAIFILITNLFAGG
jgi:PTS system galactitol-specific IIC component